MAGNWPLPIQRQMKVGLWQGIGLCQYKDRRRWDCDRELANKDRRRWDCGRELAFANTRTDEGGTVAGNWPLPIQRQTKVGL